jgi:O-acetyl-ADP-ribose deacetylase (regulator of RNase III)
MGKTCFVIMPFGIKPDADAKLIDFDKVYKYLISQPIEKDLKIQCTRCDLIEESGWIHAKMFRHIYESDVAVVDITCLNPNVFYEMGVRHALADSVTVLLRRKGTKIPFNIQGFTVIEYDHEDLESIEETKTTMVAFIRNGLKDKLRDSPVHEVLNLRIGDAPKEFAEKTIFRYRVNAAPDKFICLITGNIRHIKGIDIWVNSENTNMQMARHFDRSISGVIRYCGAKKSAGRIVEDTVAKELTEQVGEHATVAAGEVIVTGAGELEKSNGVKRIFHAASVAGEVSTGYLPISDVGLCVRNALARADEDDLRNFGLQSILFPLLGTGTGRGDLRRKAETLICAAINHLKENSQCSIQDVYFLNWTEQDLETCKDILDHAIGSVTLVEAKASATNS